MEDAALRQELANFLKIRRARLRPQQVGLPEGERRRTPGLRREEVALLAGMSSTWYTWLEQGRRIQVSAEILNSLARTLQLNPAEHAYLLQFASPSREEESCQETVKPTFIRTLNSLNPLPAYIRGQRWDVLAWNRATCAVLGSFCKASGMERNIIWRYFLDPEYRRIYAVAWQDHAQRLLAQLRASAGTRINSPWFQELIEELRTHSPEFRYWWARHDVLDTEEGRKEMQHPQVGPLAFEHTTFVVSTEPALHMVLYTPLPEYDTGRKLVQLLAVSRTDATYATCHHDDDAEVVVDARTAQMLVSDHQSRV